ncbi:tropomyosin-1, isoforms 9A/A/B-like [Paramacrobiotus metropolitanus]|uniref:tropomyosin-1, isoforms 9A/A/B-like n=1 Tax=Paramacrobiotus metropolitanus TaxID=2943436 RepID=UPI002446499D|nr:tropomyosin-1, isoforms 9A/A/B-like [Paramacrobiotus metropolitanus]
MSNPKKNEYAREFNTDYSRRLTSNAPYSLRHAGRDGSQPSSTDSTKSVEAREKRNERILLADSNPTSDDSFEDAHDKTFLEPKADLAAPSHPTGEPEKLQAETTLSHAEAEHPHGVPTSTDLTEGLQLSSQKAQEPVTTTKVTDAGYTSPNQTDDVKRYQASTLEYTARKWIASTPPEKIEDIDRLRKRCQDLITQIVLADQIVNSTENQMSRSEDTHKLERKRWEKELAEANNGIAAQQRRIEHLESHLKRSDNPCRYDPEEVERLRSTLATSVESVFELKRRLATAEKDLADTQTALVESELAAGTFHQQLKQANEEAEVYRNEVDRYIVELKHADDEVDRQKYRIEQLEREMETLLVRAGRQLMAHYGQQPASPDRSRATTDLEQANAQLADQVYGLNDVLKEEQRLRAQLEHSLAEAQKVYEAQQNRIAHLEVRENDLYNYGLTRINISMT